MRVRVLYVRGAPRPPEPPAAGLPHPAPASDGGAVLAWVDHGVLHYMTPDASLVIGDTKSVTFLSDATPLARLRAAKFPKISLAAV